MCGFLGDDDVPEPVRLKEAPPEKAMEAFINEVFGVEMKRVKDPATGEYVMVEKRLARTPERQGLYDEAVRLMRSNIENLKAIKRDDPKRLANYLPAINTINNLNGQRRGEMATILNIPNFDTYVEDFKNMQIQAVNDAYSNEERALTERLNRAGYGNSTALNERMAALSANKANALVDIKGKTPLYAQQLLGGEVANRSGQYGMRENARQGIAGDEGRILDLERGKIADERNNILTEEARAQNLYNLGGNLFQEDQNFAGKGNAAQVALQNYGLGNQIQMQRHNAENDRRVNQYNMDLAHYNAQGPGLGEMMLGGVANLGMQFAGAGLKKAGGAWGSNLAAGMGW